MSVSANASVNASTYNIDFECYGGKGVAIIRPAPPMLIGFGWIVPPTTNADAFIRAIMSVLAGDQLKLDPKHDNKALIKAALIANQPVKMFAGCDLTGIQEWCDVVGIAVPSLSPIILNVDLPIFDGKYTFTCKIERLFEVNTITYACDAPMTVLHIEAFKALSETCEALAKGNSLAVSGAIDITYKKYGIGDFTPLWQIAAFCNNLSRFNDRGNMVALPCEMVPKLREVATLGGANAVLKWLENK